MDDFRTNFVANENVPGLFISDLFLTSDEEEQLLEHVDDSSWETTLRRRVQNYGFMYDYKKRRIDESMRIDPLPNWANELFSLIKTHAKELISYQSDQLIVNEYTPGQGISAHTDCVSCFHKCIIAVSLGSDISMVFKHSDGRSVTIWLPRLSVMIMSGDAAYEWTHEIPPRKSDIDPESGCKVLRERRVSLTFRKVKLQS